MSPERNLCRRKIVPQAIGSKGKELNFREECLERENRRDMAIREYTKGIRGTLRENGGTLREQGGESLVFYLLFGSMSVKFK